MRYNSRGRLSKPPHRVPILSPSLLYSKRVSVDSWTERLRLAALASLAHELRTPIQVLLGYLDTLKDQLPSTLPARSRKMLERMNANACELARIVENIMDFALDDAHPGPNRDSQVPTLHLLDEVLPLIESICHEKGLNLEFELDDAPVVIYARHRQLRLVLANLAVNAVRFTAVGGVKISIRRAGTPDHPEVVFEVSDTGPGFGPELREELFEPFARLSSSNSCRYRGLGLGLTVVKRSVAALNGNLEVHSTVGEGSRFVVTFPVHPHEARSEVRKRN
ncbi:MAG TPA: HAMP domain-containing sensor histidine kinase [Candidatus Binataceae bacterium]|nr:HAMP domain-containing sensor histidine kinase [Candidatus Binataceae bacterium]